MKTNRTIKRLQRLYDFMQTRKPGQFYFGSIIREYDYKNECGTICCAYGWLPHVFPGNFRYEFALNREAGRRVGYDLHPHSFFGISGALMDHLFTPRLQCPKYYGGTTLTDTASLSDFLSNFQIVLTKLQAGELDFALSHIAEPETSEV